MRRKFFYQISTLVLIWVLVGCSKSNNCDPNDENSKCYQGGSSAKLLLTEQKTNGQAVARYEYDKHNRRILYTLSTGKIEYTYNNQGGLAIALHKDAAGTIIQKEEFSYGTDGRPNSLTISFPNTPNGAPIVASYKYSERKIVETSVPQASGGAVTTNTYSFDTQGNLITLSTVASGQEVLTTWSDFDDKNIPTRQGDPWPWKLSKNNAQQFKVSATNFNLTQRWEYTYNEEAYPIKALVYVNGANQPSEEHTFTYKKAK